MLFTRYLAFFHIPPEQFVSCQKACKYKTSEVWAVVWRTRKYLACEVKIMGKNQDLNIYSYFKRFYSHENNVKYTHF